MKRALLVVVSLLTLLPVSVVAQVRPPGRVIPRFEGAVSAGQAMISTGHFHTCALKISGRPFCWGNNSRGQLGDGTLEQRPAPARVRGRGMVRLTRPTQSVGLALSSISAGEFHSCGLTRTGEAYCWGSNREAQLGDGKLDTLSYQREPTRVTGALAFESISAGGYHTCALTASGDAYCWGSNAQGQVGDRTFIEEHLEWYEYPDNNRPSPTRVTGGLTFASISAGELHTCALTAAGKAYCWGLNHESRLGIGWAGRPEPFFRHRSEPTAVAGDLRFTLISAGGEHTCGVATDGTAYCWGFNQGYQLGDGTYGTRLEPVPVSGELMFKSVSAGTDHTCAVATDGAAYCWGKNNYGQIGNGTEAYSGSEWDERAVRTPTPVTGALTGGVITGPEPGSSEHPGSTRQGGIVSFTSISAGVYYTCGISTDGAAYCWGEGGAGQLGYRARGTYGAPVAVADWR